MKKDQVRELRDAFVYITDCNLATVSSMAMLKNRGANEYERQIRIAQHMVDWGTQFGCDFKTTRADDVIFEFGGSVAEWARQYDVKVKK